MQNIVPHNLREHREVLERAYPHLLFPDTDIDDQSEKSKLERES
jgi:hypothetical protein